MHFGFSYVGLIFLLMLFIPNGIWAKNKPQDYDEYSKNENKIFLTLERIGEVLVSGLIMIFSDCNVRINSLWIGWLVLAFLMMVLYELYWIRYFKSDKTMADMYSSFAGFPVAGASLPVVAVLFLGIYASNIFIIVASIILGIGHIGIHLDHRREVSEGHSDKRSIKKILKIILLIPVTAIILVIILFIGIRNVNTFKYAIDTDKGINEETYVDINGQKQFITIRGRDKYAPVILYLHGGPGSPDSPIAYSFSRNLIDEYTVVCWDQRGCGRTYQKNDDKENATVNFEQALEDINVLVEYLKTRFSKDRIIIMGHSYGSVLGSRYVYDHPENTTAFIGIGQFVSFASSTKCEYEDALEKAQNAGEDTTELTKAYEAFVNEKTIQNANNVSDYASKYHDAPKQKNTILTAFVSPSLSSDDIWWYTKQTSFESFMKYNGSIMDYLMETDLRASQTSYEVPVFFISGDGDWNCAWKDMVDYAEMVGAKYDIIEGCGHYVHNDAPEKFAEIVKEDIESCTK